jgi:uncharacterized protein (TIGR02145 family)
MKTGIFLISILFMSLLNGDAQTIMNIHQSNGTILQIPLNTIDSITYTINNPGDFAVLSTLAAGNITSNGATSGGNITNSGGTNITQRGVCWSTSQNPSTADNSTSDGAGVGSFTSTLNGLTANTTYYVRAYAINSAGTAYGNEQSFITSNTGSGIVSNPGAGVTYSGYTYSSVVLGNGQEWMSENLRTTTYRNGDPISTGLGMAWISTISGAYAVYNDQEENNTIYGKLYNWFAVEDSRNLCPAGWHVPTDSEWTVLIDYLGGEGIAGGKMKTTSGWDDDYQGQSGNGTDEIGFAGLPAGKRDYSNSAYSFLGQMTAWWSSTDDGVGVPGYAWVRFLLYSTGDDILRGPDEKHNGFSVRCLRD